jgi:hypothetical protein
METRTFLFPAPLLQDDAVPDHSRLAQRITTCFFIGNLGNQLLLKNTTRELAVAAALSQDAEQLDMLATIAVSCEQASRDALLMLGLMTIEFIICKTYEDSLPTPVPANISRVLSQYHQVRQRLKDVLRYKPNPADTLGMWDKGRLTLVNVLSFGATLQHGFDPGFVSTAYERIEDEYLQQHAMPLFEQLPGFSYQELGWPEDAAPAPADGGAGEAAAASDENATAGGGDAPAAAGGDV